MNHSVYVYILVMAGVTYLIRMLPLVLFKKEITVCEVFFILCALCLSGSNDISGHTYRAVFRNDCRGSRPWRCSDRSIPGKKSSYGSSLRLRGSVCGRADSWISGII